MTFVSVQHGNNQNIGNENTAYQRKYYIHVTDKCQGHTQGNHMGGDDEAQQYNDFN